MPLEIGAIFKRIRNVGDGRYSCQPTDMNAYYTRYYWSVNCTNGAYWSNETFTFTTESAPGPWWNTQWLYRKEIIIDHSKVAGNLINFPVSIQLSADDELALHAQSDGDDIVFTTYAGSQLSHEIELFNESTGELVAWVNVTSLSSTEDTFLYLYYGNPTCSTQENPSGVWDDRYVAVWHMNDETTTTISDSTGNENTGTKKAVGEPIEIDGIVGWAQEFDATDDYISVPHDAMLNHGTANFTLSAWVYGNSAPSRTNGIVGKYPIGTSTTPWYGFETDYHDRIFWFYGSRQRWSHQ